MASEDPLAPPEGYGATAPQPPARPGWNTPLPVKDGTTCDAQVRRGMDILFGIPPVPCTAAGVIRVTYACKHEHLGLADLCNEHQFAREAPMLCARCRDAGLEGDDLLMTVAKVDFAPLSSPV